VSDRTEVVSAVAELIENGGQTDKMTCSKKEHLMNRQTKDRLTGQCVMDLPTVHLGMSVRAFVGGRVDSTVVDLLTDQRDQGLMSRQRSEPSMVVIVRRVEVDFVGDVVTVLALEIAVKEPKRKMPKARTKVMSMSNKEGKCQISREIEEALANGENDRDSMKMWNDQDLMTEEVGGNLFVVAGVVGVVDSVEVGEVLTDPERETLIDILKGMFYISVFSFMPDIHL